MRSLILTSILVAATGAHAHSDPDMQRLIALDAALQNQAAAAASGGDLDAARELLARSEQIAAPNDARAPDGVFAAKLMAVEGLRHNLRLAIEHPSERLKAALALPEPQSARLVLGVGAPGTDCSNAIALEPGRSLHVSMPGAATRWFSVRSDSSLGRELAVSTRGSTIDSAVRIWSDCRELAKRPLAEGDDNYGLQAIAPLPSATHPLIVEVRNLGGEGIATIDVITAVTIRGRVTREDNGAPLTYIGVEAYQGPGPGNASYVGQTSTGSDGNYALTTYYSAPEPTNTYVRTTQSSYEPVALNEAWQNVPCPAPSYGMSSCGPGVVTPVATMDGVSVNNIDFALSKGGSVSGQVRDSAGNPLNSASVYLSIPLPGTTFQASRTTDAQGRYRFAALPNGNARLQASHSQYRSQVFQGIDCASDCASVTGTPVSVSEGPDGRADFELNRLASIEVSVTIDGTAPSNIGTIYLTALNAAGTTVATSYFYSGSPPTTLGPLPTGSYRIRASGSNVFSQVYDTVLCAQSECTMAEIAAGSPVMASENSPATAISMNLRRLPELTGTVTDSATGAPISNARVALVRGYIRAETYSDSSGQYRLRPDAAGSFLLYAQSDRHLDEIHPDFACERQYDLSLCPGGELVTFTSASAPVPIDFALQPSAQVSGRVDASPSTSYEVRALSTANQRLNSGLLVLGAQGAYTLSDLVPRTYRFGVDGYSTRLQLFDGIDCGIAATDFSQCPATGATHVALVSGQMRSGVDFEARNRNARRGHVIDASTGAPLSGIIVDVWDQSGARIYSASSDAEGRFEILYPYGSGGALAYVSTDNYLGYRNEVYDGVQCALGSVYQGTCTLGGGTQVAIPGPEQEIVFALDDVDRIFGSGFE